MGGWRGSDDDYGREGDFNQRGTVRGQYPVTPRPDVQPPVRDDGDWRYEADADRTRQFPGGGEFPGGIPEVRAGVSGHRRADRRAAAGVSGYHHDETRGHPQSVIRTAVRGFGEVLITLGLVVLLFAAYEVYGKALQANAEQNRLYSARLGKDWVVVEGVKPKDIKLAPGRYPKSQLPGQLGNFAIAGHRMPSIFWDLDKVKVNDPMVAETRTGWYVYTVTRVFIIKPTRTS